MSCVGSLRTSALVPPQAVREGPRLFGHTGVVRSRPLLKERNRTRLLALLVLVPTGDGSCDHLDDQNVPLPDEIRLSSGLFEVGREPPADIVVSVPTVSTRHAMLRLEDDKLSITDLNSTNGTYVDDEELVPMRAMEVSVGAEVTFGDMFLAKFKVEDRGNGK